MSKTISETLVKFSDKVDDGDFSSAMITAIEDIESLLQDTREEERKRFTRICNGLSFIANHIDDNPFRGHGKEARHKRESLRGQLLELEAELESLKTE